MRKEDIAIFRRSLAAEAQRLHLPLSKELLDRLSEYYRLLASWNSRIRLVGSVDPKRAASELFGDSLLVADFASRFLPPGSKKAVLDIGSGAGFPGAVAGLAHPEWSLTLVEADAKKLGFLKTLCRTVGPAEARLLGARAEELAHEDDFRSRFDLVFCKAVASPRAALELSVPFLRVGGSFLLQISVREAQKDAQAGGMLEKASGAIGGSIGDKRTYGVSFPGSARLLVRVEKLKETPPQYPRRTQAMRRRPLG
jgi:16S rRNA (guanine527-N7)-methyltransferase